MHWKVNLVIIRSWYFQWNKDEVVVILLWLH